MTWFLFELVVLTAIGTFFRGPGWGFGLAVAGLIDTMSTKVLTRMRRS